VQDGQNAETRTQVPWLGRDFEQSAAGRTEEQIVEDARILQCERRQSGGQREHHVRIGHGQQRLTLRFEPFRSRAALALGTVAVATGIVGDPLVPALITSIDMAAERSGTAGRQCFDHLRLGGRKRWKSALYCEYADQISDFQCRPWHSGRGRAASNVDQHALGIDVRDAQRYYLRNAQSSRVGGH